MTKRIIDGMSAEQIAKGWSNGDCQDALVEYLESICKSEPSWEDDVAFNAIPCFVGNSRDQLERKNVMAYIHNLWPDPVHKYGARDSCNWKHAIPISPNDCWKPTNNGGVK